VTTKEEIMEAALQQILSISTVSPIASDAAFRATLPVIERIAKEALTGERNDRPFLTPEKIREILVRATVEIEEARGWIAPLVRLSPESSGRVLR
jgi:hypothetical protein